MAQNPGSAHTEQKLTNSTPENHFKNISVYSPLPEESKEPIYVGFLGYFVVTVFESAKMTQNINFLQIWKKIIFLPSWLQRPPNSTNKKSFGQQNATSPV